MSPLPYLACFALMTAPAFGATIVSLYNTGVDDAGVALPDGATDSHYLLVFPGAQEGVPYVATGSGGFPIPPWIGDSATSAWTTTLDPVTPLGPGSNTNIGVFADYYYETTFDMTGLNPQTAQIAGQVSYDNFLQDVQLNGQSTGISADASNPGPSFGGWLPFSFDAADVALLNGGVNTLTFIVRSAQMDGANDYTGVRVEFLQREAAVIPEPSSFGLLATGLLAIRRRRR
ncbi:MAG: PEP-CTERM sorting domain-containing protein [Verrucomicrobiales bacterium]